MSSDYDCHVYLIDGGRELALIDTGSGLDTDGLVRRIEHAGLDPERVTHVFLTHKHADHAGGTADLQRRSGLAVHASVQTAEAIADERPFNDRLVRARRAGTYPADYRFSGARVDHTIGDGARVRVGDVTLEAIDAPGHCAGHLCFLFTDAGRRHLFSGDAIVTDGLVILQATPDCSLSDSIGTIERLAALEIDAFLPGHFMPRVSKGHEDIAKSLERIQRGLVPMSAI